MKNILVTGGAGFVGSHIIDLLTAEDCGQIVAIDNMTRGRPANLARALEHPSVSLIEGDIRDADLMKDLVRDADVVFHQAALRITQCNAEMDHAMAVMVGSTFNLLRLCIEHEVEKIVLASSASVYGMAETFPTDERHHPYDDRTLYGAAKTFNEGLLRFFEDQHGLNYVALRYFNAYGPRMDIHGKYTEVMIRWMERIESGEPPLIFGDGTQTMDFVDVRDIARANILAAQSDVSGEVFNVGCGQETSLKELANLLARAMGAEALEPEFVAERKVNPVARRLAGTSKAAEVLGFEARVSLEEGLEDLVGWWRQEQAAQP